MRLLGAVDVPDVIAFNAAMAACQRVLKWTHVTQLFEDLQRQGRSPDGITYNVVITTSAGVHDWAGASLLLSGLRRRHPRIEERTAASVVEAAARSGSLPEAFVILREALELGELKSPFLDNGRIDLHGFLPEVVRLGLVC